MTTTVTPSLSPSVSADLDLAIIVRRLVAIRDLLGPLIALKSRIVATVVAPRFGLPSAVAGDPIMTIDRALERISKRITPATPELRSFVSDVLQFMESDQYAQICDLGKKSPLVASSPPVAEEPEPKPEPSGGIALPDVTLGPRPVITPTAEDPMSGIAANVARHLAAVWKYDTATQVAELTQQLRPAIDKLTEIASRPAASVVAQRSGGSNVDEAAVRSIVTAALNNGAGDALRALAEPEARKVLASILDDAKARVIAEYNPATVELMAAYEPLPDPFYDWTPDMEALAEMIESASDTEPQNVLLVGPSGAGKTALAIEYAAKFGRKVLICDPNLREAREWFGEKGASGGSVYFRISQFWMAVATGNCVVLFDEFNRLPPHIQSPLYPLLDHRRSSYVDAVQETLRVGPRTVFFATLNEGLDYTGTHAVDRAMKNRFSRRVEITYLTEDREIKVLTSKVSGLDADVAKRMVEAASAVRSKAAGFSGGLSETISTRQLLAAAQDYVRMGEKSLKFTILSHFSADGGVDSERAQVVRTFEGKGFFIS